MEAKPGHEPLYVPPPPAPLPSAQRLQAGSGFFFQWNPPTCRPAAAGAQLQAWPAGAQAALQAAAGIMESLLLIRVPIEIEACWWDTMPHSYLGTGGPLSYGRDDTYPLPTALYPISLANQITGDDLLPGAAELEVNFNGSTDWYFGTDGHPGGKYDFMTVALHELTHGLGFIGNMTVLNYVASCGDLWAPYCPTPYDSLAVDALGNSLVDQIPVNPVTVAGLLKSEAYLKGTELLVRNGSQPARLSTPSYWEEGSSYTHLDGSLYSGGNNALMTPSVSSGTAIHHPGPVVLGLFKDMGWTLLDQGPVVQLSGPTSVPVGGTATFTADLWPKPASGSATYTWTSSDHPPVQHSQANGFDTVALVWNTTGTKNVQVSVNYSGQTLVASRQVTVFQSIYLPLINR